MNAIDNSLYRRSFGRREETQRLRRVKPLQHELARGFDPNNSFGLNVLKPGIVTGLRALRQSQHRSGRIGERWRANGSFVRIPWAGVRRLAFQAWLSPFPSHKVSHHAEHAARRKQHRREDWWPVEDVVEAAFFCPAGRRSMPANVITRSYNAVQHRKSGCNREQRVRDALAAQRKQRGSPQAAESAGWATTAPHI